MNSYGLKGMDMPNKKNPICESISKNCCSIDDVFFIHINHEQRKKLFSEDYKSVIEEYKDLA